MNTYYNTCKTFCTKESDPIDDYPTWCHHNLLIMCSTSTKLASNLCCFDAIPVCFLHSICYLWLPVNMVFHIQYFIKLSFLSTTGCWMIDTCPLKPLLELKACLA